MITSSEATFRALLSSSIADAGERERLAAQLARASEAEVARQKTELAATLRQEISAPLNSIIATAEQLRRSGLDHPQREHAESLAAAARALLCLVTDLLDVSKADTERLALDPVDFDLRAAVEEACAMLREEAERKGLELALVVQPDVPRTVNGDRTRLRQVLWHLLSNAVKFTIRGEVVVGVSRAEGERLRFTVSDTGPGIDPELARRLFAGAGETAHAPTYAAGEHGARDAARIGLGLSISRELVQRMGGESGVEPREGGGSVFWFTAALAAVRAPASDRPADAQRDPVKVPAVLEAPFAQGDGADRNGAGDVLDEPIVAQLKGTLTPSMCRQLLEEFEASLPRFLVDIESAFERNDAGALRRTAHLLRGASATLGATRLSDACARLERTRADDPPIGEQQLAQLREALDEACLALRERLA
jgi:signal transduction histidine kinase/HPt (histidine-containing phosphotransfer) domain-containing protein